MGKKKKIYLICGLICLIIIYGLFHRKTVAALCDITREIAITEASLIRHEYWNEDSKMSRIDDHQDLERIKSVLLNAECRYQGMYRLINYTDQVLFNVTLMDEDGEFYARYSFVDDGRVYANNGKYHIVSEHDDIITKVLEEIIQKYPNELDKEEKE